MLNLIKAGFCSTGNSFKSKSKLTDFYKAIHPDMLYNAPENVKIENSRSLKMLNSYFDCLAQNQRTEAQELTFFIANKSNTKARQFYPITISLDAFLQKNMEEMIDRVTIQIRDKLNQKQQEIRTMHIKKKEKQLPNQDDYDTVKANFLSETTSIKKRQSLDKLQQENALRLRIFGNQVQDNFEQIEKRIKQQMRASNMPYIKPSLWQQIQEDEEQQNNVQDLSDIIISTIDPRLIYIDQQLTLKQIDQFKQKIIPSDQSYTDLQKLQNIFNDFESQQPQIYLYITNHYGYQDIPGYFSIPYNFEISEIYQQYGKLKQQIIQNRQQYEQELAKYQQLLNNIKNQHFIQIIDNQIPLKNSEILQQLNLSLLMLSNQLQKIDEKRMTNLRYKQWILTDQYIKTTQIMDQIYIPIPFNGII